MSEELQDLTLFDYDEEIVLVKFHGDSTDPADAFERITILNGEIVSVEQLEGGL